MVSDSSVMYTQVAIAEHLDLDDLSIVSEIGQCKLGRAVTDGCAEPSVSYSHPCRCSGSYLLHEEDLSEASDSVVVPCSSCSLHIRVSYSMY